MPLITTRYSRLVEQRRRHPARVAAGQVDGRRAELPHEAVDRHHQQLTPVLFVDRPRVFADRLVVGLAADEDLRADVANLSQRAVDGEGDAETGAQREHQFDAVSFDRAERGQRRVVDDPHVATGHPAEFVLERETLPLGLQTGIDVRRHPAGAREVARPHDATVDELSGEADADSRALAPLDPLVQRLDQSLGRARVRRGATADHFEHVAVHVDVAELDVGRADVDRQDLILHESSRWRHQEMLVNARARHGREGAGRSTTVAGGPGRRAGDPR